MPKYTATSTDANHAEIRDTLRLIPGVSVADTHRLGHGFPDIVVGYRGCNYLMEIKTDKGELNQNEVKFFDKWKGQITIVRSLDDALGVIGL